MQTSQNNSVSLSNDRALDLLRHITVAGVKSDAPDLTARQTAVLLTVYRAAPPHTVRGLSANLKVAKPAITRALDRLGELQLIRRQRDEQNRRSVLILRTEEGHAYLGNLAGQIRTALDQIESTAPRLREAA